MEIVQVAVNDTSNVMYVENCTAVEARVFNISDYDHKDLIVRIEQIEVPDIRLHDFSLSHMTLLRALYCICDFDYSSRTLSVPFYPGVSADNMSTPSTGGMTVRRQVLINDAKGLFLDGRQCLEAMRQLHVKGDIGWLQQHILVCVLLRDDSVVIDEAKGIQLSKLANRITGILRRFSSFVDLLKTILN